MGETLPSNTGGVGLSPGQRTKGSHVSGPKTPKNRSNVVTNSIEALKTVHMKKKILKKVK